MKVVSHEERHYFHWQLRLASAFPRKPSSFGLQKRFMHASHFIPQNMKKMGTRGRDRSLIHDFYYFVKDILK